jgi:hypothetical protein
VIAEADEWRSPITLRHHVSGRQEFIGPNERAVIPDAGLDSAAILVDASRFALPQL